MNYDLSRHGNTPFEGKGYWVNRNLRQYHTIYHFPLPRGNIHLSFPRA